MQFRSLVTGFLGSLGQFPGRPALEVNGVVYSYSDMYECAAAIAATLQHVQPSVDYRHTAILSHRSHSAFAGILAALLRGHTYVPLSPSFPARRLANILKRSKCETIIVGAEAVEVLRELLPHINHELVVVLADLDSYAGLDEQFPNQRFLMSGDYRPAGKLSPVDVAMADAAYMLFTSGSTGQPKGVPITHSNIRNFIDVVVERYAVTEQDRFSQMFDLVFDLSLFDIFVAWECGGCICCPSAGDAQMPAKYVIESKITVWFSVPSLGHSMGRMRMLIPGIFDRLRLSLFCGEALMEDVASKWQLAAPNSIVENIYGPTEVTLACTYYRWVSGRSECESENGVVPIGKAFPGMTTLILTENGTEAGPGELGELLMCGPQVAAGYWEDAKRTRAAFVTIPGRGGMFYRTGDLVRQPRQGEAITYQGRLDHQIKVRGNRVELGEIEAVLRSAAKTELAIAIGWPMNASGADGIVAFVQSAALVEDLEILKQNLAAVLPGYMVPREIRVLDRFPLNSNGKIDRNSLRDMLESKTATAEARGI